MQIFLISADGLMAGHHHIGQHLASLKVAAC
jgi:hypothetical protein